MTLDLSRPDQELIQMITEWCSQFGPVKNVEIFRIAEPRSCTFAAVEMSSRNEAIEVFKAMGATDFGSVVMIKLEQEEKSIPEFLRRR